MTPNRNIIHTLLILICIGISSALYGQGEVGFGTDTPAEKADINGALIIRTGAAAVTPVAGTIRWNTTDGMHDGRVSTGSWIRLENDNTYEVAGDYTSLVCGTVLTTSAGNVTGTSSDQHDTPFGTTYQDKRAQYLYKGSDIVAGGLCAGYITQIGFQVTYLGSPATLNSLQVKMKMTTTSDLTGTAWETGMTTLYGPGAVTLALGPNYISLTSGAYPSGFYWDGYSNILVEICYDNASNSLNSTVDVQGSLTYNATRSAAQNFTAGCGISAATTLYTRRPVIFLTGNANGPLAGVGDYLQFDYGVNIGNPVLPAPYLSHGPGSVTAEAIYDENIIISDYVFDHYYDGIMMDEDLAKHADYKHYTLDEMAEFMEKERHLPTIKGRDEWNTEMFSTGELATELWVTFETHALYLKELHERTAALESIMGSPDAILIEAYEKELQLVNDDATLSASEKQEKINLLNKSLEELKHAH